MEAELDAEEAAAAERGEENGDDDEEDEESDVDEDAGFGQRTGFREPPFVFEYGFNPLVALGEHLRSRHPRRRLKHLGNVVRAFRVERSVGVRAVTFAAAGPCSVEVTATAAEAALAQATDAAHSAQGAADAAEANREADGASFERCLTEAAVTADHARVCETVAATAQAAHAASKVPGGSDGDVSKVCDPRLSKAGRRHAEGLTAELALTFTQPASPLKRVVGKAEAQRQQLLEARGEQARGPFDLVVSAPLTACLETVDLLLQALPGEQPQVVVDPALTTTAVLPKGAHLGATEKRDAQLPCRKGRSAFELKAEFPSRNKSNNDDEDDNNREATGETKKCSTWDFSALESPKTWRVSSNPVARPGYFHPLRLEGQRSEEALEHIACQVPKNVLVVGQPEALARLLGVGAPLLASAAAAAGSTAKKAATTGSAQYGLVRRTVGSEFSWASQFLLSKGRGGEVPLARALVQDLLPSVSKSRGLVGFALHFEHEEGEKILPGDVPDDHDLRMAGGAAAYGGGPPGGGANLASPKSSSDGYESYGRKYEVRGVLHLTWSNAGFADECNRLPDLAVDTVDALLSKHGCAPLPPGSSIAETDAAKAAAAAGEGEDDDRELDEDEEAAAAVRRSPFSQQRFCAKVDKWPLSLPGQGQALTNPKSRVAGCVGKAALFMRLSFPSALHLEQGRKTYRDKILQNQAAQPGFIQSWLEVDSSSNSCRVTSLWNSVAERDTAFEISNDLYTSLLAPLSKPGTMQVCRGRTIAPNVLPDGANRGLYDDFAGGGKA
jgi:broad specificity phosphatase PhoE